jgi:hypothetical protein
MDLSGRHDGNPHDSNCRGAHTVMDRSSAMTGKAIMFRCRMTEIAPNASFFVTFHFPEWMDHRAAELTFRAHAGELEIFEAVAHQHGSDIAVDPFGAAA